MIRVAITGHRGLPADTVRLVSAAIRTALVDIGEPFAGISCIADGADQIFARAVLAAGGALEVVVPAEKYRDGLPAEARNDYDALFAEAVHVHRLNHIESTEQAHMDASAHMLRAVDRLWAVWDGEPARGYGGTADVVALAKQIELPVTVIWPVGAHRD